MLEDVFSLFPTAVAKYRYYDHEVFKKSLYELIVQTKKANIRDDDTLNSKHYFEQDVSFLDLESMSSFKKFVLDSVNSYCNDVLEVNTDLFITEAWVNQTNSGYSEHMHNHGNWYVSAVYYVNYNKEKHSPLEFQNNKHKSTQLPYLLLKPENFNKFNAMGFVMHDVNEGNLIVFPSHIEHGFNNNQGNDRISIAFNFLPKYGSNGAYKFGVEKI